MKKWATALMGSALAALCVAENAYADDSCVRRSERMALKVAALQQQLMVAALQQQLMVAALSCRAIPLYNRFVISYREELLTSDDALMAFLTQHGGVAEYHAYKTRLANNSSLASIGDAAGYCRNANAEFSVALAPEHGSLRQFAAAQNAPLDVTYTDCTDDVMVASREERQALRETRRLAQASAAGEP